MTGRRNFETYAADRARARWTRALLAPAPPFDVHALARAIGRAEGLTPTWALRVRTGEHRRRCAELAAPPRPVQAPVPAATPAPAPLPLPSPPPPASREVADHAAGLGPWARVDVWRHGHGYRWRATWAPPCEPDSAEARGQAVTADAAVAAARAWVDGLRL